MPHNPAPSIDMTPEQVSAAATWILSILDATDEAADQAGEVDGKNYHQPEQIREAA